MKDKMGYKYFSSLKKYIPSGRKQMRFSAIR
jgi:hypothetical protein